MNETINNTIENVEEGAEQVVKQARRLPGAVWFTAGAAAATAVMFITKGVKKLTKKAGHGGHKKIKKADDPAQLENNNENVEAEVVVEEEVEEPVEA